MNTYSRFVGTGSYFPEKIMTNKDFEKFLDTNDEWIVTRTGMKERRVAAEDEFTSDMAAEAAKRALDMAGMKASELDGIIIGTFTMDTTMPSTGCRVQEKIGAGNCFAFDLQAKMFRIHIRMQRCKRTHKIRQCQKTACSGS